MSELSIPVRLQRHGAFLAMEEDESATALVVRPTRTKLGARRAFGAVQRTMLEADGPAAYVVADEPESAALVAARVESGAVVESVRIPFPWGRGDASSGVREPRRPLPSGGAATAVARPEDDPTAGHHARRAHHHQPRRRGRHAPADAAAV